ncbi:MAG: diguanylate cyclase [Pseudomonadales bacterium]|nr:diguanylate cyclase [Pseudomonadales bacterium]
MNPLLSARIVVPACLFVLVTAALVLSTMISSRLDTQLTVESKSGVIETTLLGLHQTSTNTSNETSSIELQRALTNLGADQDISFLFVTDPVGNVVSSLNPALIGKHWTAINPKPSSFNQLSASSEPTVIDNMPMKSLAGLTQFCGFANTTGILPQSCGVIYMEVDLARQLAANNSVRIEGLLVSTALTVFAAILILIVLSISVTSRAEDLIRKIGKFKKGNRDIRIPVQGIGELASLSNSVNELFENIQEDERAVSEKGTRYESLIDTMADGLITLLHDGTIESMNFAAERLLGFEQKELVGKNISLLVTDPEAANAERFLNSFIEQEGDAKGSSDREIEVRTKDAEVLPMRLSMSKMKLEEETLFIGLLSDISRIKSMEKELRTLNKELSETNEQLEQTVITDALTGLYNRRHFDSTFSKELQRSTRQRSSISLIVVDIDFFKQFNDRYGHALGDECLARVSSCIKNVFKRSGDLPARYGGEEFAIILPGCDGLELQERAETLRMGIYDLKIPHSSSRADEVVTVSVGAVTYKPASKEVLAPKPKELFTEADKALYRAKASGRNRVVFAGQYQPIPILSTPGNYYGHLISR